MTTSEPRGAAHGTQHTAAQQHMSIPHQTHMPYSRVQGSTTEPATQTTQNSEFEQESNMNHKAGNQCGSKQYPIQASINQSFEFAHIQKIAVNHLEFWDYVKLLRLLLSPAHQP